VDFASNSDILLFPCSISEFKFEIVSSEDLISLSFDDKVD